MTHVQGQQQILTRQSGQFISTFLILWVSRCKTSHWEKPLTVQEEERMIRLNLDSTSLSSKPVRQLKLQTVEPAALDRWVSLPNRWRSFVKNAFLLLKLSENPCRPVYRPRKVLRSNFGRLQKTWGVHRPNSDLIVSFKVLKRIKNSFFIKKSNVIQNESSDIQTFFSVVWIHEDKMTHV